MVPSVFELERSRDAQESERRGEGDVGADKVTVRNCLFSSECYATSFSNKHHAALQVTTKSCVFFITAGRSEVVETTDHRSMVTKPSEMLLQERKDQMER